MCFGYVDDRTTWAVGPGGAQLIHASTQRAAIVDDALGWVVNPTKNGYAANTVEAQLALRR
eukprot:267540-Alexandrium_andersonii.AAC.1